MNDQEISNDRPIVPHDGRLSIASREVDAPLSIVEVLSQLELVKQVQTKVMKDGMHFGTIPGTKKPTLYQPGAQTLLLTFRLAPSYTITRIDLPNYHREYTVKCALRTISGGVYVGEGVGSASTMESKYRWHKDTGGSWEATEHSVPQSYWQLKDSAKKQALLRQICDDQQASFGTKKLDDQGGEVAKGKPGGEWRIVKFSNDEKEQDRKENPNIADTWNTILKMAAKRALVCATLNVTAASDVFTQDLEDLGAMLESEEGPTHYVEPPQKQPSADNPPPPKKTPTRGANAQETAWQAGDKLPMGGKIVAIEPPEKILNGWRDCVVHVKSTIQNKKLGDLSAAHLETIKAMWFPTINWMGDEPTKKSPVSSQDWTLKACVLRGLKDLAEGAPIEEPPPAKQQPPVVGKSAEKPVEPSERDKLLAQIATLCEDSVITESTLAEQLAKGGYEGFPEDMTQVTDPRIPDDALKELVENFPALMLAWGFKDKPVEPKPKKKLGGKK